MSSAGFSPMVYWGGGAQVLLDPPSKVQCKRDTIYMQRLFGFFFFFFAFVFFCSYEICMHGMLNLCRMYTH